LRKRKPGYGVGMVFSPAHTCDRHGAPKALIVAEIATTIRKQAVQPTTTAAKRADSLRHPTVSFLRVLKSTDME
jgi:hypothetical protein